VLLGLLFIVRADKGCFCNASMDECSRVFIVAGYEKVTTCEHCQLTTTTKPAPGRHDVAVSEVKEQNRRHELFFVETAVLYSEN